MTRNILLQETVASPVSACYASLVKEKIMTRIRTAAVGAAVLLASLSMTVGQANADTNEPNDKVGYDRMIVLPTDFLATGRVSAKVGPSTSAVWQPVKATIVCSPVCIYVNPPDNVTRLRVVNPKTKEATVYLVVRVEPGAPLSAVPLSDVVDETYPA